MANERRYRANNIGGTITDDPLAVDATSFNSAGLAALGDITAAMHAALPIEEGTANFEVVYITAHTAGATSATIARGQEGTTAVEHAQGAAWTLGPTARDYALGRCAYVSSAFSNPAGWGATTFSTASVWTDVRPGGDLDLSIKAFPGDIIRVTGAMAWNNEGQGGNLDMKIISGSSAARMSGGTMGCTAWRGLSGNYGFQGGSFLYRVAAADLTAGVLTTRLQIMTGGAKGLAACGQCPLMLSIENLGAQEA